MNDLRVPKRRIDAEVELLGGATKKVALFVGDFASSHSGPERPSDLLAAHDRFIPAQDATTDGVLFLQRDNVVVLRVPTATEPSEAEAHTLPTEYGVKITVGGGRIIVGQVSFVRPPDRTRLIDFLNSTPDFIRVLEKERVALVNVRHILHVELTKT